MRSVPAGWSLYYRVVRRIPRGRVATYGQVALAAGRPRGARQVGYALAALRGTVNDVPWQRVLGSRARGWAAISLRDAVGAAVQQQLLEEEGVVFDDRGRVELARFGWRTHARTGARSVPVGSPSTGKRGGMERGRPARTSRTRPR